MNEDLAGTLNVGCECGQWLKVEPVQPGTATACECGRRVVIPLLEEFR